MSLTRPRKSPASRADRPSGRVPFVYTPSRAGRIAGWTAFHTLVIGSAVGGFWWHHINVAPTITVPARTMPESNSYAALTDAANRVVQDQEIGDALQQSSPAQLKKAVKGHKKIYTLADKEALVDANADALRRMRAVLPGYAEVAPIRDWKMTFPELAKFRGMARLMALEAQVAAAHGDYKRAAASSLDAMELGERIGHGGVLIHKLVSIACEAIGRKNLMNVADKLSAQDARWAVARLESIASRRAPMSDSLTEEKWATQAELNSMFRKDNLWSMTKGLLGTEEQAPPFWEKARFVGTLLRYSKTEIADAHRHYLDSVIAQSELPFDRSRPEPTVPPDVLNQILSPVFSQAGFKEAEVRAENALLVTRLALHAYRIEHGMLPETLNVLVQERYLGAVPVDPFTRDGRTPVQYVRKSASEYLLYSVGPDGVDNHGMPAPPDKNYPNRSWIDIQANGDFVLGANFH